MSQEETTAARKPQINDWTDLNNRIVELETELRELKEKQSLLDQMVPSLQSLISQLIPSTGQ